MMTSWSCTQVVGAQYNARSALKSTLLPTFLSSTLVYYCTLVVMDHDEGARHLFVLNQHPSMPYWHH